MVHGLIFIETVRGPSGKASLSCYIYCDLRQLMVILRIVCVIYCDFAIVCDIYCDLWQFCNNFKFFSLFWFFGQFTAFSLVTWGLLTISLLPKDPDTSLSLKDPLFSHLIVKQVTKLDFSKTSTNLMKCWENFGPESTFFVMHFTKRPPIFVRFVTERPPFLKQFVTERPYIRGAWWHSYVLSYESPQEVST